MQTCVSPGCSRTSSCKPGMPRCAPPGMLLVLLESGVGLASCDARGRNALHVAAAAGHTLTALTLLRRGCSVAALDHEGTSVVPDR